MKKTINISQLARDSGYSRQRCSVLLRRGLTRAEIVARGKARKGLPKRRSGDPFAAKARKSTTARLAETLRRKEALRADRRELDLRISRGELVPIVYVFELVAGAIIAARDIALGIGPELRDALAVETDPVRCQAAIETEMRRVFATLESAMQELEGKYQ